MKYALTMLAIVGCLCSPGKGETRDAHADDWDQQIAALAAALAADDPAPAAVMLEGIDLRQFDPTASSRTAALLERTSGSSILFWRLYTGVPTLLAADMAEDINTADVPEPLQRRFTPAGSSEMRDANTVAADWIRESLAVKDDQPIAVILTWRNDSALPSLSADHYAGQLAFILIAGEKDPSTGRSTIQKIVFGNPLGKK